MLIDIPIQNDYRSVWDKPVPIIEVNKKYYRVYLLDEITSPNDYGEVVELLRDLKEDYVVEFELNTPGGSLDTATMLMNAIAETKAKTIGRLSGSVASAGTMITMVMDEIIVAPYTAFMIHHYSSGLMGKGSEIKAQQNFMDKELTKLFKEVYKGFLTPQEIKKVIDGQDIWLNKEEVVKRFEKMKNSRID